MSSRKELMNSRLIESFSLRQFLVFNSGEFIAFDDDKFARILRHSKSDGALEISLYALESSFDELLNIRVLSIMSGHNVVVIHEDDVQKNIICYSRTEFGVGGIGAPSNKIPIINGMSDVFVSGSDIFQLPTYMTTTTIRTKSGLEGFITTAFSHVADDRSPLNLFLDRCHLSLAIQKALRLCCKSKTTCSANVNGSHSFMLYLLCVLISRGGVVSHLSDRSQSKLTLLDNDSLAEDVRFSYHGLRVTICNPDETLLDFFGSDITRAIKPRIRTQISANELPYTTIQGDMKFDIFLLARYIHFSFKVQHQEDDNGHNKIERYKSWSPDLPDVSVGTVYAIGGQYYEVLRFDLNRGLFVNLSLVSESILTIIREHILLKKDICHTYARFLILKPKEELLEFIQAKPIAGLNLEHPKLFNISKEIINLSSANYLFSWLKIKCVQLRSLIPFSTVFLNIDHSIHHP